MLFAQARQVSTLVVNLPRSRFVKPGNTAAQRRLTTARFAYETKRLALHDGEINV